MTSETFRLQLRVEPQVLVVQPVPELPPLGGQVVAVLVVRRHLDRHLLHDPQPVALEARDLARVVRQDPDRREPEVGEDLVADPPLPRVLREPELEVRLDGVEPALLLELVRAELVEEPMFPPSWDM